MINVMLVEDQTLVRQGIKSLLGFAQSVQVVAEAENGEAALTLLSKNESSIDVVLMDIRMPVMTGIQALAKIQEQALNIPVIMLTTFDDHESVIQAIKTGAKGYLLKDVSLETLVASIETVYKGETLIQPAITERLIQGLQGKKGEFESAETPEPLTKREAEILRLMAAGCSNKEMAASLYKSEGTIKNQVSSILSKLGVRDRTRAVLKAIESGII